MATISQILIFLSIIPKDDMVHDIVTRILRLNGKEKNLHSLVVVVVVFSFNSGCLLQARHLLLPVTREVREIYYYTLKNKGICTAKS